jgi:hypothetical protein
VPPAPGMIPRPVSGWPNCADSEATIRSHASASSQPPPRQQLVGERVQLLGPVEQDDRDRAVALGLDQAHFFSRKRSIAFRGSSVAIESASQSRAWLIVWCHAKSFQKFRCSFA